MLSYPNISISDLAKIWPRFGEIDAKIAEQIEIDAKYDVYLSRQAADVAAYRRDESFVAARRLRLRSVAGIVERSETKIADASSAHHRTCRPHRRHDAGGADAARCSCPARKKTGREKRVSERGQGALDLAADKARALQLTPVSRETEKRLDMFVEALLLWQQRMNLVASSTLPQIWTRHIADSLQLVDLAPEARVWVDFGAGGGFPGIPIACALVDKSGSIDPSH